MKTFGRTTIYVPYTEKEILAKSIKDQNAIVLSIIENSLGTHEKNKTETIYLKDYLRGIQDIYLDKKKFTREEINNKTVENWAYAFVDFKKCYLLSEPIQYVQIDNSSEEEIAILNKFVRFENKKAKDMSIYEDVLVCGRGFMYKCYQTATEDDEAPFEILPCPAEDTEVVYSSKLGSEQIGSYVVSNMTQTIEVTDELGNVVMQDVPYLEITFYLRNRSLVFNNKNGKFTLIKSDPIILGEHSITEYYVNRARISLIEIGKDLFNDINYLESLDKDDMESYVNAIMVFTNVDVSEKEIDAIKELGAVSIASTDNKKASIELLQQRLNAEDTQTYYTRLLTSLHQILGLPLASDNGTLSSGDTGRAKLVGSGYTMATIRTNNDITMYGMCDMEMLKGVLKACKMANGSGIKTLKISEFEPKFNVDMSDNILTKTQALLNLYNADIPRKFANSIVSLFSDPNAITQEQEKLFGEQISQMNKDSNADINIDEETQPIDKANQQANALSNALERDEQGQ